MVPAEVEDEEKIHRRTFSASQPIQASANQVVEDGEQLIPLRVVSTENDGPQ